MSVNVEIEGLDELQSKLKKMSKQKRKQVDTELQTTALEIETGAKKRCAVDTGRLRASIHHIGSDLDYEIYTDVEYARKMEVIQPFMFPAYEFAKSDLMKRLEEILGRPD